MSNPALKRDDLIFPELSYTIIGCAYEVFNELGPGHAEKYYQRAMAIAFSQKKIRFKEQVYYSLKFKEEIIGKIFLDFLIEDKIVVEIKKNDRFSKNHIDQVFDYLHQTKMQLAILINFNAKGIVSKRIVNTLDS